MKLKGIELKGTYKVEFSREWFEVYDEKGNTIYVEGSTGYWFKIEYDENGNRVYYENSNGYIIGKRAKELTIEEIERLLDYKAKSRF